MTDSLTDWPKSRLLSVVTLARRFGIFEDELLAGTNFSLAQISDPRTSQPVGVEFQAIRNLQRLVGPEVPVAYYAGLDYHVRASCHWQQAVTTSERFGQALALATQYIDLSVSLVRIDMLVRGKDLTLTYVTDHLPDDVRLFLALRSLVSSAMTARDLLGFALPLTAVDIAFPRPPYAGVVDDFAGVRITWDAARTSARCDARWLERRLGSADEIVHEQAVQDWELLLERHRGRIGVAAKLREQLCAGGLAAASLDGSAESLGFSARTLRRHLASEGTSYRQVLDEARLDQATSHLLHGISIEETARRAGYTQASAFAQAFRRWTGTSPDAWRHAMSRRNGPWSGSGSGSGSRAGPGR